MKTKIIILVQKKNNFWEKGHFFWIQKFVKKSQFFGEKSPNFWFQKSPTFLVQKDAIFG